jgi:outer membrane phospholipase A
MKFFRDKVLMNKYAMHEVEEKRRNKMKFKVSKQIDVKENILS